MAQIGRPRTFDREAAVEQAMLLFWQHGYESTSLSQLKAEIGGGISAPSFYAAFGSKENLFNEAAARYAQTYGKVTDNLFDPRLQPREAIETTLRNSAAMQCDASHPLGCMVALGTIGSCAPLDSDTLNPLAAARLRNREAILACVERGIESADLPVDADALALATVFEGFLVGISPLARDGVPLAVLDAAITSLMGVWTLPRLEPSA